jgi:hypothetical protein
MVSIQLGRLWIDWSCGLSWQRKLWRVETPIDSSPGALIILMLWLINWQQPIYQSAQKPFGGVFLLLSLWSNFFYIWKRLDEQSLYEKRGDVQGKKLGAEPIQNCKGLHNRSSWKIQNILPSASIAPAIFFLLEILRHWFEELVSELKMVIVYYPLCNPPLFVPLISNMD